MKSLLCVNPQKGNWKWASCQTVVAILFASVLGSLSADTIGWWRFEGTPGGQASGSLANSATGASALPALTAAYKGDDQSYLPKYIDGFTAEYSIFDPATRTAYPNAASLSLRSSYSKSPSMNGYACMNASELPLESDFTMECFFRVTSTDENVVTNLAMAPILTIQNESYKDTSFQLYYGKPYCRSCQQDAAGTLTSPGKSVGDPVLDGKWHHAAIVFAAETGILTWYLDYRQIYTQTLPAGSRIACADDTKFFVGANEFFTSRNFPGEIDEVRVSNVALAPRQFLRFVKPTDDDHLMVRLTFDESIEWWGGDPYVAGVYSTRFAFPRFDTASGATTPVRSTENLPGDVYESFSADEPRHNAAKLDMNRSTASKGSLFVLDYFGADGEPAQAMIHEETFTIEFFCRFKSVEHEAYTPILNDGAYSFRWCFYGDSGATTNGCSLLLGVCSTNTAAGGANKVPSAAKTQTTSFADGEWHHFALVYDRAANKVTGYVDYGSWAKLNVTLADGYVFAANNTKLVFGGRVNSSRVCDAEFDEIRISDKALRPCEFMTPERLGETRLWMHFNGNYEVGPMGVAFQPDAVGAKGAAFSGDVRAPSFSTGEVRQVVYEGNSNSLRLAEFATVAAPEPMALEGLRDVTVEAFLKIDDLTISADGSKANFILSCDGSANTMPDWQMRMASSLNSAGNETWSSSIVWCKPDPSVRDTMSISIPNDQKWHHVAFSFKEEPNGTETNTTVRFYLDYENTATKTVNYARWLSAAHADIRFMSGETWGMGHDYLLDEVRVTAGVLEPSAFLRKSRSGIFVIVR